MSVVHAQSSSVTLSIDGCVDASGFSSCQSDANDSLTKCLNDARSNGNTQTEILACGCTYYTQNINCAASSCWNRVYECNYQSFVTEYLANCPIAKTPVPYFPVPDNAPDSCSCNVGEIYLAIQNAIQQSTACSNSANGPDASANVQEIQGCFCCAISASLSSIYGICPDTDPTLVGLGSVQQLETNFNAPFDTCGPYLSQYDCVSSLGFSKLDGSDYLSPDNLPKSGTATLSNKDGTVTAPASGSVFTYTNAADKQVYTIKAANANGDSKAAQTTGSGGSGGSGGSETSSGNGPSATGNKKNDAKAVTLSKGLAVALVVFTLSCAMAS